jgi:heme-degrading monooxygenase HmoA
MRIKPGMEETLAKQMRDFEAAQVPGVIATYVYRMDADPHDYYMAVVWESKESYLANANSPEQHARYLEYRQALEAAPEWHDGEIVHVLTRDIARP